MTRRPSGRERVQRLRFSKDSVVTQEPCKTVRAASVGAEHTHTASWAVRATLRRRAGQPHDHRRRRTARPSVRVSARDDVLTIVPSLDDTLARPGLTASTATTTAQDYGVTT